MATPPEKGNTVWKGVLYFYDQTNWVVISLTSSFIVYTRFSPGPVYFSIGAVAASRVAKILKLLLREKRPEGSRLAKTYGMPSTHSSVISYYAAYTLLATLYFPREMPYASWPKWLPPLVVLPWAISIVFSRIWLGHHTLNQVLAGSAIGVTFALGWFQWWQEGDAKALTSDAIRYFIPNSLLQH